MILSFLLFLSFFAIIGISSIMKSKGTKGDYYLASSSISPPLVGLSAVATNNSGYMFIGVIGYTYVTGLASVWLMIGWLVGDFIGSTFIHSRLRKATEKTKEVTFAGVLSRWHNQENKAIQRLIALISLLFMLAYAGAQLVAGSKALHVLFGWPNWAGAIIGATLVILYCFAGGIRASIWTDAAQSVVMMLAMITMLIVGVMAFGNINNVVQEMDKVEGFLDWFPKDVAVPGFPGLILFIIGWFFAGISVIGQPHIMVRFMTLSETSKMQQARTWYYVWFVVFYIVTTCIGMLSRIHINDPGTFDPELALPRMAMELLPPFLVGLVLAGVFAATISTADSLVISCSSAMTHDLLPQKIDKPRLLKMGTALITVLATGLAIFNKQSVFSLVIFAWSGLASAFGPLLIYLALGGKPKRTVMFIAIFSGLAVAIGWRLLEWHNAIYEGLPGILTGLSILYIAKWIGKAK